MKTGRSRGKSGPHVLWKVPREVCGVGRIAPVSGIRLLGEASLIPNSGYQIDQFVPHYDGLPNGSTAYMGLYIRMGQSLLLNL